MTHSDKLKQNFFSDGTFDSRKWRNKLKPEIKAILDTAPYELLSAQVYFKLNGAGQCLTCGKPTNLRSFNAGWFDFCSTICGQQSDLTKAKIEKTTLERHGGKNIWEIPGNRSKIANSISKAKRAKREITIAKLKEKSYDVLSNDDGTLSWEHSCGKTWESSVLRSAMRCPKCSSSQPELDIIEYIKSIDASCTIKNRDRKILWPKEIDILVNNKIGIEYNGAYWHRDSESRAVQDKVINAHASNIKLITVLESDWKFNKDKVKDLLKTNFSALNKIGARKLELKKVSKLDAKEFLEANHFNGWASARECFGLYRDTELMMIATFSPNRFSKKKEEFELIRLCTLRGFVVQGGLSRLISHWKNNNPEKSLISYHDLKFGWSESLQNAGFEFVEVTKPGWRWIKGKAVLERWQTQKKKISKIIPDADLSLTEIEIMKTSGWIQEFNPGNTKWKLL